MLSSVLKKCRSWQDMFSPITGTSFHNSTSHFSLSVSWCYYLMSLKVNMKMFSFKILMDCIGQDIHSWTWKPSHLSTALILFSLTRNRRRDHPWTLWFQMVTESCDNQDYPCVPLFSHCFVDFIFFLFDSLHFWDTKSISLNGDCVDNGYPDLCAVYPLHPFGCAKPRR